ncbi:YbjN domain-containing protein [Mycobacterium sp. RTGN5]|uniref:YbjN domain-containing protein n=1 Tax=Mycobacterium sp. RTGN5 TaxID=3016522 RepID=UPI0029C62D26|nr:YbjN domain-containing protein [Mycobacterium sp. RTGN5]
MNTASGTQLIERYLSARQLRHFRGHHDDEYFFLVNAYHGRLHVHLQPGGPSGAAVQISITAERYYPAEQRARVERLVEQWNNTAPRITAAVFESSDPRLVGVRAERRYRAGDTDFGSFVDQAVQSAIDLFGRLRMLVAAPSEDTHLLDAG